MQPKNTQFIQQGPQSGFCSGGLLDRRTIRKVMEGSGEKQKQKQNREAKKPGKEVVESRNYKVKDIFPQQN